METFGYLAQGFGVAFTPLNIALAVFGCFLGTLIGALPGMGPINGIAVLIPLAFALGLDPTSSLILLCAVYYGTQYGGSISSIVLNIPGEASTVMTTLDGYPMARAGRGAEALGISAFASFVGGTIATIGLTLFSPTLARAAIHFGPAEYFALYILAFATIGGVTGTNPAKTLLAACLGLALSTVGLDPISGVPRYTFGVFELFDGINPIVAIVGLFAISEFLLFLESSMGGGSAAVHVHRAFLRVKDVLFTFWATLRGSLLGFFVGVLPGAGASLASFLTYVLEKKVSDKEGTFGHGDPRGVAAPEAGNNAAAGGALIPMLSLGVPGSGTTAIMLALLISLNIQPGPLLFERQPEIVWGLIAALYFSNVILVVMNIPMVGVFTRLLLMPTWMLMPTVVMVSFVGIYSINHSGFDILVMVAFGILGYALRKMEIPLVPIVLGLLLGGEMEQAYRRALSISGGDHAILVQSWISLTLYAATFTLLAVAVYFAIRNKGRVGEH